MAQLFLVSKQSNVAQSPQRVIIGALATYVLTIDTQQHDILHDECLFFRFLHHPILSISTTSTYRQPPGPPLAAGGGRRGAVVRGGGEPGEAAGGGDGGGLWAGARGHGPGAGGACCLT